jgi:hypothetical protein
MEAGRPDSSEFSPGPDGGWFKVHRSDYPVMLTEHNRHLSSIFTQWAGKGA